MIDPPHQRGVDRCFMNFTSALAESFPGQVNVFSKRDLNSLKKLQIYPPSKYLSYPIPQRIGRFLDSHTIQFLANSFSDIYFSPYYGNIRVKIPQVFMAHDMIYEKFPHFFPGKYEKKFIKEKKDCFYRASLILCNSQSTYRDIREFYPDLPESRFRIVHLGVGDSFRQFSDSHYTGKPYFLFVGNRSLYKNFLRFLIAFGKSNLSKNFCLRIISPINDFPTDQEMEIINKYHLENDIQVEISISDEVLHERYAQACAYICPSEYEGFGLPLVEAMASGTLALASNTSSLPEIGGLAPIYFDPLSEDEMTQTLIDSANLSSNERQDHILKGKDQSLLFSWKESRKNFISALESIL